MIHPTGNAGPAASGRRHEGGFALLVIFLIAAAVAFTMYQELPRAAFESARDKEQLLMDRGNQYKRAIQVYYAVNKRYPADLKDLENTNDKRFLRRRYKDPMTGEDEWRLVHTNGSFLTDSLVEKPPAQNAGNGLPGAGQTPGGGPLGANNLNSAAGANAPNNNSNPNNSANNANDPAVAVAALQNPAALRRPSDRGFPTGPGSPQPAGLNPANQPAPNPFGATAGNFDPNDPSTWPPITLATTNGQPNAQAQPQPQLYGQPPGFTQTPGTMQGGVPAQPFPSQPLPVGAGQPQPQGIPGQFPGQGGANPQQGSFFNPNPPSAVPQNQNPNPSQFGINPEGQLTPLANQPNQGQQPVQQPPVQSPNTGLPFFPQPLNQAQGDGFNPQPPPAILNPRPGGAPNPVLPGAGSGVAPNNAALQAINTQLFRPNQAPGAGGPTGSPGIAGVASKFEGPSIKAYRERTKYQEWEFVYQPPTALPGQVGAPGQNAQQSQNPPGQNPATQSTGQTPAGGVTNPFTQPNPFSPPPNPMR